MRPPLVAIGILGLTGTLACGGDEDTKPTTIGKVFVGENKYPEGWRTTGAEATRLFAEGRKAESTSPLQKVVDAHPEFPDAHFEGDPSAE